MSQISGTNLHTTDAVATHLIFALFLSHDFETTIGDDLIGVHVGRSPGPALDQIHRKLVHEFVFHNDFVTGGTNRIFLGRVQMSQLVIRQASGLFHHGETSNQRREMGNWHAGNVKVINSALCLNAVVSIDGLQWRKYKTNGT